MSIVAVDLFAGTGWGVACQRLGIEEHGVELMPEAVATREAAGMRTIFHDVWDGLDGHALVPEHELLIASPPCQTFSMAGSGAGRRALDEVLGLIESRAFLDPAKLRAFGEAHDPRTALVLTPLTYVARHTPTYAVFEQVPTVLPVWKACAEVMRAWGYSVAVEVLSAEQYGVPQTRKRAILVARADGVEATMPPPSHSRYYSHDKTRLDPGVAPWVSMAEALGWDVEPGEVEAVRTGMGAGMIERHGDRRGRDVTNPAFTVVGGLGGNSQPGFGVVMRSNYGTGGDASKRGERTEAEPAPTMTSKADRNMWMTERPATTVQGDSRVWAPGHKVNAADEQRLGEAEARARYGDRAGTDAVRVTLEEAAALQSYPAGFPWREARMPGGKPIAQGKLFLQVGNAVPPLLAEAILAHLLRDELSASTENRDAA